MRETFEMQFLNGTEHPKPRHVRFLLEELEPVIKNDFSGYDTPLPAFVGGCTLLLIGCGSGRDAFVAQSLVGSKGRVIAVDDSQELISVAKELQERLGNEREVDLSNLEFVVGSADDLNALSIEDESIDVLTTNYSFNFVKDKPAAIREFRRVLKQGAELYLSALFGNSRITDALTKTINDPDELLKRSIYLEDFRRWMRDSGWESFRYAQKRRIVIQREQEKTVYEGRDFIYRTVRTFKIDNLEDLCENYGQSAEYLGTLPGNNQFFDLDDTHRFFIDQPLRVCGNTYAMVANTRFAPHFRVEGSRDDKHFGLYTYCHYCGIGREDPETTIEYQEEVKSVCVNCQHHAHCVVDGHCQHEEAV